MTKNHLNEWVRRLNESKHGNLDSFTESVQTFAKEAEEDYDQLAMGYAAYFETLVRYRNNIADEESIRKLVYALQIAMNRNYPKLEVECHNVLGVLMLTVVDESSALEHYEKALEIAEKHHFVPQQITLSNNIGDVYLRLGEYDTALDYFRSAYKRVIGIRDDTESSKQRQETIVQLNLILLNMAVVDYLKGDYEEAFRLLSCTEDNPEDTSFSTSLAALSAIVFIKLGRTEDAMNMILKVLNDAEEHREMFSSDFDYIELANALIDDGNEALARRLLITIEYLAQKTDTVMMWCTYHKLRVRYEKKFHPGTDLTAIYDEYFKYHEMQDIQVRQQKTNAARNRRLLEEEVKRRNAVEEQNKRLRRKSEHDALTGVYNRYALNSVVVKWFDDAKRKQHNFGVMLLDIDHFKEYNDNYGHLKGDEVLREISDILTECTSPSCDIIIRYGGDEFFIVSKTRSDEEMIAVARDIREALKVRMIAHDCSSVSPYVTVTQGAVNGLIRDEQTLLDYIHLADSALYKIKNLRKNALGFCRQVDDDYVFECVDTV
jgi:diguanylate cyclase (GGDEF)-like protein